MKDVISTGTYELLYAYACTYMYALATISYHTIYVRVHVPYHHLSSLVDQLLSLGVNVTVYNGQLDLICDTVGELPPHVHFRCLHSLIHIHTHTHTLHDIYLDSRYPAVDVQVTVASFEGLYGG